LTINVSAGRRPDYAFYGIGPLTASDDRARYGADTFDARAVVDIGLWRSSKIETAVGFRSAAFRRGYYLGQLTIEDRAAAGTSPLPDGYSDGYEAAFTRAKVALDTRRHGSISGSGARLELEAEQGTDLKQAAPSGWMRYGGAVGGFLDLGDNGRVMSLSVSSVFADPLGAATAQLHHRGQPFEFADREVEPFESALLDLERQVLDRVVGGHLRPSLLRGSFLRDGRSFEPRGAQRSRATRRVFSSRSEPPRT